MTRTARLILAEQTGDPEALVITQDGKETRYELQDLRPDPRVASPAWRLTKTMRYKDNVKPPETISYDVHLDKHGPQCTCGDYVHRQERHGTACKHILAMTALGLLPK